MGERFLIDCYRRYAPLEQALVSLCRDDLQEEKIAVVSGSTNRVMIKELERVKWPAKNTEERSRLIGVLKKMSRWEEGAEPDPFAISRIIKDDRKLPSEVRTSLKAVGKVERTSKLTLSKKKEKDAS